MTQLREQMIDAMTVRGFSMPGLSSIGIGSESLGREAYSSK
ncbi:MAG: hypothetical protein ABFR65_06885 [Pseudomonadota bacterium]